MLIWIECSAWSRRKRAWGIIGSIMPSWNIHIALAERVLDDGDAGRLGIADENSFLFGNCVPDVYVGFMVPDASLHVDYCITHLAKMNSIPVPDADLFWDNYVARRRPKTPSGTSLALGAWAHVVADRYYNGRFRTFSRDNSVLDGKALRLKKQADFDLFGSSFDLSRKVDVTQELLDAAWSFVQYRILPDDVERAALVVNRIVDECGSHPQDHEGYQLLSADWMGGVFEDCLERIVLWLQMWRQLEDADSRCLASDIREKLCLPPMTPDNPNWRAMHG